MVDKLFFALKSWPWPGFLNKSLALNILALALTLLILKSPWHFSEHLGLGFGLGNQVFDDNTAS